MKKQWFFDRFCGQQVVALVEDGKITEFAAEKESDGELVGNIYKGRIVNVLSGLQAAFVSCGLEKNCYLSTNERYVDCSKYDAAKDVGKSDGGMSELKVGDEVIVQVVAPPRGNKGAKVTTHLSFVGKNLIYLPGSDFLGISRKITDEKKKEKMLAIADKLRLNGDGFIVRTLATSANKRDLKKESEYLKKLFSKTMSLAKNAVVGDLLYRDLELPVRVIRDSIGEEAEVWIGDKDLYEQALELAKLRSMPGRKIKLYDGERSMLREFGVSALLQRATRPVVELSGGGYIVIETTEAMTVVDVNTGSFVGDTSLEETAFAVNMRAAEEVARQVRLRNVGGLVVVDFIDMAETAHRESVTARLVELLGQDKAKCNVLPMSELCLTEFTRKRVGSEVLSYLVKPCGHCFGRGSVRSDVFLVADIRADILDRIADGYRSVVVDLNEQLMKKILTERLFEREINGRWKDIRVYMIPHKTYEASEFTVRGDNSGVLSLPDKAQILY